jgi:uncharacterized protein (TIGR02001 family)
VIARAVRAASLPRLAVDNSFAARTLLFVSFLITAGSAFAQQLGGAVSAYSDSRFRGYSLSEERPVGVVELSYDDPSGFYLAMAGSAVAARGEGPQFLGAQINGGYATRLRSGPTLDVGAVHSAYSHYAGLGGGRTYTEFYAGIALESASSRISVSPNYFGHGWTVHPEMNGHIQPTRNLSINANVGLLVPMSQAGYGAHAHPIYDARLGVDQMLGRFTLHGAVSSRGKDQSIYSAGRASRNAFVIGITYAL